MNYLCSTTEHPTAEQIYSEVRKAIPNISLGTVYRNLSLLEELGKVRRVVAGHDAEHFDANMSEHHHFVCSGCGSITDITLEAPYPKISSEDFTGSVTGYDVVFHGLCESCAEKSRKQSGI